MAHFLIGQLYILNFCRGYLVVWFPLPLPFLVLPIQERSDSFLTHGVGGDGLRSAKNGGTEYLVWFPLVFAIVRLRAIGEGYAISHLLLTVFAFEYFSSHFCISSGDTLRLDRSI